jgi:hypothetical protein
MLDSVREVRNDYVFVSRQRSFIYKTTSVFITDLSISPE